MESEEGRMEGRKEGGERHCIPSDSHSGVCCCDSFGLSSAAHAAAATIRHRWRDGTGAGGKRRRGNQNNPELPKTGSWGPRSAAEGAGVGAGAGREQRRQSG